MKNIKLRALVLSMLIFTLHGCSKNIINPRSPVQPMVIAHRGGQFEAPENTLYAFKRAIEMGVDGIELDVQLSKEGIPVLYHPSDLNIRTDGQGTVSTLTVFELKQLNAGYRFTKDKQTYPLRDENLRIPTLEEVFKSIPKKIWIIIDLKSLPASSLVNAVFQVVDANNEWDRVFFYSTSREHTDILPKESRAIIFEPRDETRLRLLQTIFNGNCYRPLQYYPWIGFELRRAMTVMEKLQLGEGRTELDINLWNKKSMQCVKETKTKSKVALFGINTEEEYAAAVELGVDAIYTDWPQRILENAKKGKKR